MMNVKFLLHNSIFLGFAVAGACMFVWEAYDMYFMHQSQHWSKIAGTVRISEVIPAGGYYGWPDIVYDYSLNGISYQSGKISFGDTLGSRNIAQALTKLFPVGRTVDVVYNPTNPAMSCLIPGPLFFWETCVSLVLYAGFLLAGAAGLREEYKRSTKSEEEI
jgi:hypothetical protein